MGKGSCQASEAGDNCDEHFRAYDESSKYAERVRQHYKLMRTHQTLEFNKRIREKYSFEDGKERAKMTVKQAFDELENYVDSSDPDLGLPNSQHALQTAEAMRAAGLPDYLQLAGLIHDFGKIMYLWGTEEEGQVGTAEGPQWALGGDTWAVGCAIPDSVVYTEFNKLNPDMQHPVYSTELGMYSPGGCGLDKLMFAFGHDEYMYLMLKANSCQLPEIALKVIRYHSAYCWHDKGAYGQFLRPEDTEVLETVRTFNKFDLYTKDEENVIDPACVWPYWQGELQKRESLLCEPVSETSDLLCTLSLVMWGAEPAAAGAASQKPSTGDV
ncbi:unnamed protein product [Chrysoparadoxa australica]